MLPHFAGESKQARQANLDHLIHTVVKVMCLAVACQCHVFKVGVSIRWEVPLQIHSTGPQRESCPTLVLTQHRSNSVYINSPHSFPAATIQHPASIYSNTFLQSLLYILSRSDLRKPCARFNSSTIIYHLSTMTTPETAASRVLAIDELLEEILIYLSIDRVLLAKRVCRNWLHLIASSPRLQRILFKRIDLSPPLRTYNPLFEDFFHNIGCKDDATTDGDKLIPASLKISPQSMRKLILHCPKEWKNMTMFQPPCPYWLTMPSASIFHGINIKFMNEAHVPVVKAVEKANWMVEMEADKIRLARTHRSHLDQTLSRRFGRGVNSRLARGATSNA